MVEKVDDARKDQSARPRVLRRVGFVLQHVVKEDLEGVSEVDEVLVERGEEDGFARLRAVEVEAEDVMDEQVGLQVKGTSDPARRRGGRSGCTVVMIRKMAKSSDRRSEVSWSTPTMMPLSMRTAAGAIRSARIPDHVESEATHQVGKSRARCRRSP